MLLQCSVQCLEMWACFKTNVFFCKKKAFSLKESNKIKHVFKEKMFSTYNFADHAVAVAVVIYKYE